MPLDNYKKKFNKSRNNSKMNQSPVALNLFRQGLKSETAYKRNKDKPYFNKKKLSENLNEKFLETKILRRSIRLFLKNDQTHHRGDTELHRKEFYSTSQQINDNKSKSIFHDIEKRCGQITQQHSDIKPYQNIFGNNLPVLLPFGKSSYNLFEENLESKVFINWRQKSKAELLSKVSKEVEKLNLLMSGSKTGSPVKNSSGKMNMPTVAQKDPARTKQDYGLAGLPLTPSKWLYKTPTCKQQIREHDTNTIQPAIIYRSKGYTEIQELTSGEQSKGAISVMQYNMKRFQPLKPSFDELPETYDLQPSTDLNYDSMLPQKKSYCVSWDNKPTFRGHIHCNQRLEDLNESPEVEIENSNNFTLPDIGAPLQEQNAFNIFPNSLQDRLTFPERLSTSFEDFAQGFNPLPITDRDAELDLDNEFTDNGGYMFYES